MKFKYGDDFMSSRLLSYNKTNSLRPKATFVKHPLNGMM